MDQLYIYNYEENYHGQGCHILREEGDRVEVWVQRYGHKRWYPKDVIKTSTEIKELEGR
ncbi:hypothetical protein Elgi_37190 [Paenibacillus elgii]|uniref:hypothetical protein n=1 Tax=Paenibacillus elgii TaxID=189691 RepID=UPI002D7BDF14|nr:hypothetical protein Elgi_37190 [Paenibacillus elgii]